MTPTARIAIIHDHPARLHVVDVRQILRSSGILDAENIRQTEFELSGGVVVRLRGSLWYWSESPDLAPIQLQSLPHLRSLAVELRSRLRLVA